MPRTEIGQVGLHRSAQKAGDPVQYRIPQQWIGSSKHPLDDVVFLLREHLQLKRPSRRVGSVNHSRVRISEVPENAVSGALRHRRASWKRLNGFFQRQKAIEDVIKSRLINDRHIQNCKILFEESLDPYTIEMKHVKIIDRLRIRSVRLVSWRPTERMQAKQDNGRWT